MIEANEKRLKKLQKKLMLEYQKASKELSKQIENQLKAFLQKEALQRAKLEKGIITQGQYESWLQSELTASEWLLVTSAALAEEMTDADEKAQKIINGVVLAAAIEGATYATFEASYITDKPFRVMSNSAVEQALHGKLYKHVARFKDMQWNERNIRQAIAQSILKGESVPKAAKRLLAEVGTYYKPEDLKSWRDMTAKQISREIARKNRIASLRDARTMLNAAENEGRLAEYRELEEEGVDIEKGWEATLDERTRDSHAEMDMEFVGIDDVFSNGLECPGDPNGPPEEVYNCRCRLISKIDGRTISLEDRRSNLERSYEEWKNRSR